MKVGDKLTTAEQLNSLPVESVIVSNKLHSAFLLSDYAAGNRWVDGGSSWDTYDIIHHQPFTLLWLPEEEQ